MESVMSFKQLYAKVTADVQKERLIHAIKYRINNAYEGGSSTTGFFNPDESNNKWPSGVIEALEDAGFTVEEMLQYNDETTYKIRW